MTKIEFIKILGFFLFFFLTSTTLGLVLISFINRITKNIAEKVIPIEHIGAGLLTGMGLIAYISLGLGLIGLFTKTAIGAMVLFCLLISVWKIPSLFRSIVFHIRQLFQESKGNIISLIFLIVAGATLGTLYLAAMQPPYTSDELHYHLPEVREIVGNQKINLEFGGHPFYGNIPKLMEIIFAIGKTISSYQLSHALNFAIFLGFLLIIFGLVKKHYGVRAASLSILLLTWFDDFTWNATSGFIDAATTAFEVSALLFILDWTATKSKLSFYLSAILIGIAVSMKYSPLPTAVFVLGVILFKLVRENTKRITKIAKVVIPYFLIALIFGGFWYIKNLIKFDNPFYPLYFGHKGYPEDQYKSLVDAIHEFGPKTPAYFYKLTASYSTPYQFFVYLSIYLSPIIIFIKKRNVFRLSLFIYFAMYTLYWFFFATHQIRFLASPLIISIIILSILVSKISSKIVAAAAITFILTVYFDGSWGNFWYTKLHVVERQYGRGNVTEAQFLTWQFGCQYSVIRYLEDNNLEGTVIDNWSVWFAPSVSFYAQKNSFIGYGLHSDIPLSESINDVKAKNIKYIYFNSKVKENFLKSTDPIVIGNKNGKLPTETYLLQHSTLVYQNDKCNLYKINY